MAAKKPVEKPVEKKRLDRSGIKMIGSKWFSKKDGYKKPFKTADECAKHFNGGKDED